MGFTINQSRRTDSWKRILLEESDHSLQSRGAKRMRTFRRMYLTVFVWFCVPVLLYASLFYIGAFINIGEIAGISYAKQTENAFFNVTKVKTDKKPNVFTPLIEVFSANRVYLRQGQSIQAYYTLPVGTHVRLIIKQCKSKPVIEVFKCDQITTQEKRIPYGKTGTVNFTAQAPGFYYFEDIMTKLPKMGPKEQGKYKIIWRRI